MKSWKTTTLGICAIVSAVIGAATAMLQGHPVDYTTVISAVMAGIGLITAKDSNVTGGTVQQ